MKSKGHKKHTWLKDGFYKNGNEWDGYCYVCGLHRKRIFNDYVYILKGKEYENIPSCQTANVAE